MTALDREKWVLAALRVLADRGVQSVRVEPLAKRLGVTKGSFYWHFSDRADLYGAILEHWGSAATSRVIDDLDAMAASPAEKLRALVRRAFSPGGETDRAIRAWATHHDVARDVVERVDARRLAYVEALLEEHGLDPELATARARMLYTALVGETHLALKLDTETRVRYALANLDALMTAPQTKEAH